MYLDNKLVLVAGGTGLIGSSIIKNILENCPTTRIRASYYNTMAFVHNEKIEYIQGDLRSEEDCREMVKGCDCVIMAAANTSGSNMLVRQPWRQVNDNVIMNIQMLKAFYSEKIKRVICISSATVYQEFEGNIRENQLNLNQDPHPVHFGIGWTSRFIEKLCQFCHEQFDMEIIIIRSSNIFGPYAKFDPKVSNFIPAIIRKAVDKMSPFEVWGTPDVARDVLYSYDLGKAIIMLLNRDDIKFDIFNIGSGKITTVEDVVRWSLEHTGHKPSDIIYNSNMPTTVRYRVLDCKKVKDIIGWEPTYSVENGIKKTIEWWIENKNWWRK